jgi:hypothetical protein
MNLFFYFQTFILNCSFIVNLCNFFLNTTLYKTETCENGIKIPERSSSGLGRFYCTQITCHASMTQRHREGKRYNCSSIKGRIIPTFQTWKEHTRNQLNDHITYNNTATLSVNKCKQIDGQGQQHYAKKHHYRKLQQMAEQYARDTTYTCTKRQQP